MVKSYSDELSQAFQRWEESGFKDIKDWVTKGDPGNYNAYKSFAEKLEKPYLIRKDIETANDYGDIDTIQTKIDQFDFKDSTTEDEFNKLVDASEEAKEIEERIVKVKSINTLNRLKKDAGRLKFRRDEIEDRIDDAIDYYEAEIGPAKQQFEEAETKEERIEAQKRLRIEAPKILGALRTAEAKRAKRAFRELF